MKVKRIVVGFMQCNCYLIELDRKCILIDPGDEYEKILSNINNKDILGIIITHSHFDHTGCIDKFVKNFNCPIYCKTNLKEGKNKIGNFEFNIIYTPGHTDDSICIYLKKDKIIFTGDFIFKESIGRTDLGGNQLDMYKSIKKIKEYPDDLIIYPGHGESSILGNEKLFNPYFKE